MRIHITFFVEMDNRDEEPNRASRIQELTVLQQELSSLKKHARVYKQQRNSHILFKGSREEVFSDTKKELNSLRKEHSSTKT